MVTRAERNRREAGQTFRDLMDSAVTHLRVGQGRDNTRVTLLMTAAQAHGLDGCCTCCPRRPADEPRPIDHARAAIAPARLGDVVVPSIAEQLPIEAAPSSVTEQLIAEARRAATDAAERFGRQS